MNRGQSFQKQLLLHFLLVLSGVAYYVLAYHTQRENFTQVICLFTFLFAIYFICNRLFSATHLTYLLFAGFSFRLLLLFSVPNLSDDVYRFIWDGRLAAAGINPFTYLPTEIIHMPPVPGITNELFAQLNSPTYYTIYPPVLQALFWLAGKLFPVNLPGAIVFLKSIILVVELGNAFLFAQILKKLNLPVRLCAVYFLNPLVITELTGNVHFEGVMIFFVLLAFLFLLKNKWMVSALFMGLGIAAKLLPVVFLPLIFNKLGPKKGFVYSVVTAATAISFFTLIIDEATIRHLLNSVGLFFRNFEFNASVYYLVRWIGEKIAGYNIIATAGPILAMVAFLVISFVSLQAKNRTPQNFFNMALLCISLWFLFATTVHPWYICLPLALCIFTPYRYAIIWSFTAILSYAAYQTIPVKENLWLVACGYVFMMGYALWEWKKTEKKTYLL